MSDAKREHGVGGQKTSEGTRGGRDRVIDRESKEESERDRRGRSIDLYSVHTSGLFFLCDLWLVTHN